MSTDWYANMIDAPMIPLVRHLRNNGFNTRWCCAHGPHPYIAMDSYMLNEESLLVEFLKAGRYKNYTVRMMHYGGIDKELLTIMFKTDKPAGEMMTIEEIGGEQNNGMSEM